MKNWIMMLTFLALMVASGLNGFKYLNDKAYIGTITQQTNEQDEHMKATDRYTRTMKDIKRMQEDLERNLGR